MMTPEQLGQYPTPVWLAEQIVARYFADLSASDRVLEPSCGPGHFLQVVPAGIEALGVELDPALAEEARRRTPHKVITGDFTTVAIPFEPTVIIGNPPFQLSLVDRFLARAHALLPEGGRLGFVLPTYTFQTARRVVDYSRQWSISQELIPRNVYPGLRLPLLFALFTKDRHQRLFGFAFFRETADVQALDKRTQEVLRSGRGSIWRMVTIRAFERAGGEASLQEVYQLVAGRRPTENPFWQAQIRKIVQNSDYFERIAPGRYRLTEGAADELRAAA